MAGERDVFANFERMRREMDELFGDVFGRATLGGRRGAGFSPRVDVYYADEPARAVVKADLAGVDPADIAIEVHGRELVISGHRRPADAEGRLYQQVEIEHGHFRRVVSLGADVVGDEARAVYQDGILRVELPLAKREAGGRSVPIETPGSRSEE